MKAIVKPLIRAALVGLALWGLLGALGQAFRLSVSWPLPWVAAVGALAVELLLGLYAYECRSVTPRRARWLCGLRLGALATIGWLLLAPSWVRTVVKDRTRELVVVVDDSASMQLRDEGESASRRELGESGLAKSGLLERLGGTLKIRTLHAARSVREEATASPDGWADATDLAGALSHVLEQVPPDDLAGAILISDGRHNRPARVEEVVRRFGILDAPVGVIAVGSEAPPRDAAVVEVRAPEAIHLGDRMRVAAVVKFDGLKGRQATLRLKRGDELLEERTLTVPQDRHREEVKFTVVPKEGGTAGYRVELAPLEGERFADNNAWDFETSITDDRTHVLLVEDYPRWEFRYLRNLFYGRDKSVHLQYVLLHPDRIGGQEDSPMPASASRPFGEAQATSLPQSEAEWRKFDVVILGDLPPAALDEEGWKTLSRCVTERGALLVMIAGPRAMPHGIASETGRALVPANFEWGGRTYFNESVEPFRFALTPAGASHPVTQQDPADNERTWASFPEISWRHPIESLKEGAEVLLTATEPAAVPTDGAGGLEEALGALAQRREREARRALLVTRQTGRGKVALLLTDRMWRLREGAGDVHHHRFWGNLMRWGAGPALRAGTAQARLGTDQLVYTPDDEVKVTARLRDDSLAPVFDPTLVAEVWRDGARIASRPLAPQERSNGLHEGALGPFATAGRYEVKLHGERVEGEVAAAFTVVGSRGPVELADVTLNRPLLETVAALSGGKVVEAGGAGDLAELFLSEKNRREETRETTLWDQPWVIGLLVLLLGAEWVMRRGGGLPETMDAMKGRLPEIEARLAAVRGRIRRAQLLRAGGRVLTVALAGLVALMAVDVFFAPLPGVLRWTLWVLWLAGLTVALVKGLAPLRRRIGLVSVARWLEARHPEIEERLSTALEVAQEEAAVSPALLDELVRMAERDAGAIDPQVEVKPGVLARRWSRPALALLALLALAFVVRPGDMFRLAVRAVVPFSEMGTAGASQLQVRPGDLEVLEGGAVTIEAGWSGAEVPEVVMVFGEGTAAREVRQAMTRTPEGDRYVLEPARESFRYRVRVGRIESDAFHARVWPLPRLNAPRAVLEFPAYLGLPKREESLGARIEAVAGTKVTLVAELNTAIESARLALPEAPPVEGRIEAAAGGGSVSFSWTLAPGKSGEARVLLKHRLGEETEALRIPIEVLPDRAPEVVLLSPAAKELTIRPEEVLSLRYEVTEDFGVAAANLEAEATGRERLIRPQALPVPASRPKPPRYRGEIELPLGGLHQALGEPGEIRVRVAALDGRPPELAGPGRGESHWLLLKIDRHAESLARQQAREEHDQAREEMAQASRQAREARERMDWHRNDAKEGKFDARTREHFEEAAQKLAEAQERMEQLAARMEESVHASRAPEVRQAAEMMKQARQELESVPLQDDAAKRDSKMEFARNTAEEASKRLEEAREAMERRRSQIDDLVRLQELAAQQQELARQAAAEVQTAEPQPPDEWRNQQRGVEEALKQQLREQPAAKAQALEIQAATAQAMAAEAREQAAAQQQLAAQAATTPQAPDAAKALAHEQQEIAAGVRQALAEAREARSPAADLLPQAAQTTQQAAEALAKGETSAQTATQAAAELAKAAAAAESQPAAGSPNPAAAEPSAPAPAQAAAAAEAAARAETLQQLAGRQKQVAEALAVVESGKSAEGLQAARAMEAQAARELSDRLEDLPQLDGSGPLNDARQGGWQGRDRAKSAAEQGGQGRAEQAAREHGESAKGLDRAAEALDRAAEDFRRQAAEARGRSAEQRKAPAPAGALAKAFDHAAQAADQGSAPQAAVQAGEAAQALSEAARAAREQMQGKGPANPAGGPPMPGDPGAQAGRDSQETERPREADPGVPPQLAKLGVSAEDWEKIKESMKSDVAGGAAAGVPEEYQGLIRDYFQSMSEGHEN